MDDTVADLLSRDRHRIRQASWEIINTPDTALLETLRAALTLKHALGKVEGFERWTCWCDDYPRMLQYDPNREEESGHVIVLHRDQSGWPGRYACECLVCGRRFEVEEGEYHVLWWKWTPGGRATRAEPAVSARRRASVLCLRRLPSRHA